MTTTPLPTFFISHGGGPWPWMQDEMRGVYDGLAASLAAVPQLAGGTPKAILMVSAHWEEGDFTAGSHPSPEMIYDYGGFPEHTYRVKYAAPGAPQLAQRATELLQGAGIGSAIDSERGYDHGMFSPMVVMYPKADMPTVQLSLKRGLDPHEHLAAGRALKPLRDEGILIVGSGLSYHNLRAFGPVAKEPSAAFDTWLLQTLVESPPPQRTAKLIAWETAPAARRAHPREEHLLPLMVALGAAENEAAKRIYAESDFMGGISVSSFMFGGA